jgi:hypothetical protein
VECGRRWDGPDERWQGHPTVDDMLALFCPECAGEEFDQESD